ncbi:hypothetical protein E2C01_013378 [Portunus trituberculatus]|uniref:Uncharacterized protein n=1 Tax=Portunus trituberculatus TaxID=210409 RepID=A0A5B7DH49_PORTR|nr:hypothetical protein [Portunus trituberculatus]
MDITTFFGHTNLTDSILTREGHVKFQEDRQHSDNITVLASESQGIYLPEDRPSIKEPLLEAHHSKFMPLLDIPEVITQQVAWEPIPAKTVNTL